MQKWEYKIIERNRLKQVAGMSTAVIGEWDREITLLDLADLGNEGWELAVISQQSEPFYHPQRDHQGTMDFQKPQATGAGAAAGQSVCRYAATIRA